ncbi:thioredoxin-like protein [Pleurotus eryngii]|uniref:Glutathione peroxidase n=1 Tax=Pleurotus eryngii TaxID=5323 RepID=A0A9P6DBC9_PLEER|nr:thioredoxin-like protein [Pleurotus eryngii]
MTTGNMCTKAVTTSAHRIFLINLTHPHLRTSSLLGRTAYKYPSDRSYIVSRALSFRIPACQFSPRRPITSPIARPHSSSSIMTTFYDLSATLPGGKPYPFSQLKGKVVLIVNVASQCGFTPQYKGLQALYEKYHEKGLEILGFPCNQFGGQEPGTDDEIATFCERNHGVTFPLMVKSDVNGDQSNEVYKWLKERKAGLLGLTRIKWNFEKFLIDKEGNVVHRWASTTRPEAIDKEVAKLLQ